jgi:PAS domain S-box-containing protein
MNETWGKGPRFHAFLAGPSGHLREIRYPAQTPDMNSDPRELEIRTNILIVDDRAENLVALDLVLEPLGQNVVTARSGDEALRSLLDQDFAVILLDVLMPGLDGFETASLIRQRAKTRHIPIIFLTAVSSQEDYVARGYTIGAVDYIAKPFHPDILRAKVAVFVELYQKNEQVRRQGELLRIAERRDRERALEEVRRASEKRYQELAESMPQIVWTASADGRTTYWNRRWFDYTGTSQGDLDGEEWRRAIHLDDLGPMLRAWQKAREERRDFELAVRFRRGSDAAYRFHLVRAVAMLDALGEVSEWVGTSTDIHDRVRAEQGLQFLADASKLLSESLEHRTTLTLVSKLAAANIADWCAIDLVDAGESVARLVLSHASEERAADVAHLLARGDGMVPAFFRPPSLPLPMGEAALLEAEPAVLRLDASAPLRIESWIRAPLHVRGESMGELRLAIAESGRRFGPVDLALAEDLARRISTSIDNSRLFEAAQRERVALEAAARVKDEFLAVLSHELRTPLNATLGWAQMLKSGKLDRKSFDIAVETIERSARTQARLIEDLLDVSRIVTGKLRLHMGEVDVGEVVRAALETVQPAADAKPVKLDVMIAPGLPRVRGDAARLQQIAWNLLSNAIKFTRAGDEIRVRLTHESGQVTLVVEDDGPGIDPEFLPFVFDRFSQANSSMTRTHGGLGLGLSIVRHLAELHGGKCRAESAGEGRGARMVVDLPDGSLRGLTAARGTPMTEVLDEALELAGVHVLVVEDVADGRALFQAMLEQSGAHVRTAADAPEALALLAVERPDILVSDIGLPGMNGYELIRQIRSREAVGDVVALPALALTAYASDADRKNCIAAGFQTHVSKPVDGKALVRAIASLVRRPDAE